MNAMPPTDLIARLAAARDHVAATTPLQPKLALILGSGLGAMAETLDDAAVLPYTSIPHWPVSTVEGHAGRLVIGRCEGVPIAAMQGRVHLYEGYAPWQVVFPTRALRMLGCEAVVVTNAAGAVNETFSPGDLMLITDHLNLQGSNPCSGPNIESLGLRFFDLTHAYCPAYRQIARTAALERGLQLREGTYAALLGPAYETPAEVQMLRILGADAVGMSTAPEVIAANHAGMKVAGISCITNMGAGVLETPLHHSEVMETAERVRDDLIGVLRFLVRGIGENEGWIGDGGPSGGTA